MDCLLSQVDVWDGSGVKIPGKLYLNDLPGFELKDAEYITKQDTADMFDLLNKCKTEAVNNVVTDFSLFLNERAKYATVLRSQIAGKFDENMKVKPAIPSKYGGVQLSVSGYPYLSAYVDRISWFTKTAVTTNILAVDVQQSKVIDTLPITTAADEVTTIEVGKDYKNRGQFLNLAFLVDASLTDTYNTIINTGCSHCFYNLERLNPYMDGRGVSIPQSAAKIQSNLRGEGHTFGLSVTYSIQCDPTYFICSFANRFGMALRDAWFLEFNKEIAKSKRGNSLTTIHKEEALKNIEEYSLSYEKRMGIILENIRIPNNVCYTCNPLVSMQSKF